MPSQRETELVVIEARLLSAQGRSQAAIQLLMSVGENNLSPAGLDLLARLSLESGQIEKGRTLWNRALRIDPSFDPAKVALSMLDTPWVFKSIARRVLQLTAIACAIVLMILGVLFVALPRDSVDHKTTSLDSNPALVVPPIMNCDVSATPEGERIAFQNGLFQYRCVFTEHAKEDLKMVAQAIKSITPATQIILEGHTESFPVPPNRDYADNVALGFARAETVARVLSTEHGIPMSRIFVTSAGAGSLFPENDGIQPKNRTVVINLIETKNIGMPSQ